MVQKSKLFQETYIVVFLTILILTLSLFPFLWQIIHVPLGREYIPIHNSISDYPFYTSVIKEGIDGKRQVFDQFAIEPHQGSYIHFFYLILGWIGGFFRIYNAHIIYHLSRIILGGAWCVVIYWLITVFLLDKKQRILAYFLALFSSSFPKLEIINNKFSISWYMTWWTELDPIKRATFVPHFLAGHIFLVLSLILLIIFHKSRDKKWLIAASINGWLAGFIHPPSLLILILVLPIYSIYIRSKQWVMSVIIFVSFSFISLILITKQSEIFPWNLPRVYEGLSFAVSIPEYLLALGPILPLGIAGFVLKRKDKHAVLLFLWVIVSIVMVYIARQLPFSPLLVLRVFAISNIRFLQVAIWVPLAILSAMCLSVLEYKLENKFYFLLLVCLFLLTMLGYPSSLSGQINGFNGETNLTYAPNHWIDGIRLLNKSNYDHGAVLSLPLAGQIIPSYTNRRVYIGQPIYTPDAWPKTEKSFAFYHGALDTCGAYELLKKNNISMIFYGFDEHSAGGAVNDYKFLKLWRQIADTKIYRFVDKIPDGCNK